MQPATDGLRARLKSDTKTFHRAVESARYPRALGNGELTVKQYGDYLRILLGVHCVWESKCAEFSDWLQYGIRINERTRIPQLKDDLSRLGVSTVSAAQINWQPNSFSDAAGLMYVLEGSTLGGNILAERIPKIFAGQVAAECTQYFHAYGSENARLWREYCEFLDRFGESQPALQDEVIHAACSAFRSLEEAFNADEP